MPDLSGRTVFVTGAARGIGASYARALAAAGATVVLLDVADSETVADDIRAEGGKALAQRGDVTDRTSIASAVAAGVAAFGSIDVLVNNAALFADLEPKPFTELTDDDWDRVLRVNVRGVATCCAEALPHFLAAGGGKIINISSATVFKGVPMLAHYVASKGAVVALTRALARELGPANISVNALAPGLTESEGLLANPAWGQDVRSANVQSRCFQREQRPADLIGTLTFLASSASDFMTGQTIVVDGGSVTH